MATTSATTSSYATRCGSVRGGSPPAWLHTSAAPNSAATAGEPGVGALPGVVEQVGAGLADRSPDLGPPGVDADDEARVPPPDRGHERRHPAYLLGLVDLARPARP